jgi:hypothetical protein
VNDLPPEILTYIRLVQGGDPRQGTFGALTEDYFDEVCNAIFSKNCKDWESILGANITGFCARLES